MPRIQRNLADRATVSPAPDPNALGALEGQALQQIGGAVKSTGQGVVDLIDGYQQQLSISKSTEAEDNLRRFAEDLQQDPDFQGREKKFNERASELREELGRDIFPGTRKFEFEAALTSARNRHGINVRSTALRDQMSSAELMANDTARRLATVAATSESPFDQIVARLEGEGVYMKFGERFGIDPARTDKAIRDFNLEVDDAIFAERMRTDPVDAFRRLQVPEDDLAKGRTEVERQTMLTKSINEIESRLRSSEQDELSKRRVDDLRRKDAARNAQNAFVTQAQTPEGLSLDVVNDLGDVLNPTERKGWVQWIMDTGGKIQRTKLNPLVYQNLSDRAKSGEDVTSEVYEAERDGDLNPASRNALLGESEDSRFSIADDLLESKLRVGEFVNSPAVRSRNADAKTLYALWRAENPNATQEEALTEAQFQADRALIFNTKGITAFQLPPQLAVFGANGSIDISATNLALTKKLRDGGLTVTEYDREMDLVERFDEAQKAQALREKLKAQQAEARK